MTFKHEYIVAANHPNPEYAHKGKSDQCEYEIGKHIARTFGWEKIEDNSRTFLSSMGEPQGERMKLEIQVFPHAEYIKFRQRFLAALPDYDTTSRVKLENALKDLESFGKPSGDTITNTDK